MNEPDWKEAWERSKRLQRMIREQARQFRDEDVSVHRPAAVAPAEPAHRLHAVRPAAAAAADTGPTEAVEDRWRAIVGDRGGSYWSHLRSHLWGIVYVALGVIIGAFSVTTRCP